MFDRHKATASACLEAAETDSMTFPEIVGRLIAEGFEGYTVDFRDAAAVYYPGEGGSVRLSTHALAVPIAAAFQADRLQAAIREAQQQVAGYTYKGFCEKAAVAGCAGYMVSFPGRRAVYFGRSGETHVEYFPD